MPAQDTPPAILAAIWNVMKSVTSVAKTGQLQEGRTRYNFRSIDDLLRDLGGAFRDHGVFAQSEQLEFMTDRDRKTSTGNTWTTVRVKMRYRFTSLEDGSTLTFEAWGEGADTSDKATTKAHTMALKTALGQAFMLPTDEKDPDAERPIDNDYGQPYGAQRPPSQQEIAQRRAAEQRQQAAQQGVQAPQASGSPDEKRQAMAEWVRQQIQNPELTLERLSYVHLITGQRQMLGFEVGGASLEMHIKSRLANFGMDPNGPMPTPEQARAGA